MRLVRSLVCALTLLGAMSLPCAGLGQVRPPNALYQGKTLTQWMLTYEGYWLLHQYFAEPVYMDKGSTALIPGADLIDWRYVGDLPVAISGKELTLKPGVTMILPMNTIYLEDYVDGSRDFVVASTDTEPGTSNPPIFTIDGKPLTRPYADYYTGGYFDPLIVYPEPTSYGSVDAFYGQGTVFVVSPLPPGDHIIREVCESFLHGPLFDLHFAFDCTYIIHVLPPGKK